MQTIEKRKESVKKYYLKNHNILLKKGNEYYKKNKEKILLKKKEQVCNGYYKSTEYKSRRKIRDEKNKYKYDVVKKAYYIKNRERIREKNKGYQIKRYGISVEEYELMASNQKNLCLICNNPEISKNCSGTISRLAIDHDHITGKVRGLLCKSCNTALGLARDSVDLLEKMIKYLKNEKIN